ncbi:TPA: hypothetical protein DD394_08025, partial [bacterium UBP9_UBA11836]|nr:hypothetical protein [bacterium UBP9_UBA11836]
NFTPVPRCNYRIGLPVEVEGKWQLELNSDDPKYGGSGYKVDQELAAQPVPFGSHQLSLELTLAPLACMFYTAKTLNAVEHVKSEELKEKAAAKAEVVSNSEPEDDRFRDKRSKIKFDHPLS